MEIDGQMGLERQAAAALSFLGLRPVRPRCPGCSLAWLLPVYFCWQVILSEASEPRPQGSECWINKLGASRARRPGRGLRAHPVPLPRPSHSWVGSGRVGSSLGREHGPVATFPAPH